MHPLMTCAYCQTEQTSLEVVTRLQRDEWHIKCPYLDEPHCPTCHATAVERHVLPPEHGNRPMHP